MAFYTRVEFAGVCGVTSGDLSNYIKRQKVYVSKGEGDVEMIDDTLPANAEFVKKRREILKEKALEAAATKGSGQDETKTGKNVIKGDKNGTKLQKSATKGAKSEVYTKKREKRKQPPGKKPAAEKRKVNEAPVFVAPSQEDLLTMGIKTRNLWFESEKLRLEIEEKRMKAEKLAGTLVPVEPVMTVITQYAKGMTDKMLLLVNNMLSDIGPRHNLSSKEVADHRKELIEGINKAVGECVDEGLNNVETIVNEYSDKKGRGERN